MNESHTLCRYLLLRLLLLLLELSEQLGMMIVVAGVVMGMKTYADISSILQFPKKKKKQNPKREMLMQVGNIEITLKEPPKYIYG